MGYVNFLLFIDWWSKSKFL